MSTCTALPSPCRRRPFPRYLRPDQICRNFLYAFQETRESQNIPGIMSTSSGNWVSCENLIYFLEFYGVLRRFYRRFQAFFGTCWCIFWNISGNDMQNARKLLRNWNSRKIQRIIWSGPTVTDVRTPASRTVVPPPVVVIPPPVDDKIPSKCDAPWVYRRKLKLKAKIESS